MTMETISQTVKTVATEGWHSLGDLPDDRLVELVRQDNRQAFEALMRRHNRRLFRVARGVLGNDAAAEDAVQETYLRAYQRLDTYQPQGKFGGWLTRVALNEALMMRRRQRGDTVSLDDEPTEAEADLPTAEQFVE